MKNFDEILDTGFRFHGHRCPAMPMGLRAALAAMEVLGVERSADKELFVLSETGKGHAAGCFLDGVMTATGCTYGKSNIRKLYYNKLAFTLIDQTTGRSVRAAIKAEFFEQALNSPFVLQRKAGIPPQDIPAKITDPMLERILGMDVSRFVDIGPIGTTAPFQRSGVFEARRCSRCGELTFIDKVRLDLEGRPVCIPCSGYAE